MGLKNKHTQIESLNLKRNLRKKVVISGGAGFIGSNLANYLANHGADVVCLDLKTPAINLSPKVRLIKFDVRRSKPLTDFLKGCDIFYNLACDFGGAKYIHENKARILAYNSEILLSTFRAAHAAKIGRMVYPSSSLAYNENITGKIVEKDLDDFPPTKNPYGFIKLTGEYYCRYFNEQYGLPYSCVRMFNVYGPGDTHLHAIPNFIRQSLDNERKFTIMGDGSETRVFTFIDDIVRGLAVVGISKRSLNKTFNLSAEKSVSMLRLAKLIWKLSGNRAKFDPVYIPIPASTPLKRSVSSKRVYDMLGWIPRVELRQGLDETIKWIKSSS